MHAKANRGEISQSTVKEFDAATDFSKLPERASKKSKHPPSVRALHKIAGR